MIRLAIAAALAALSLVPAAAQTVRVVPPLAPVALPHISVQAFGTGSPVVLIPGLSSPRTTWADLVPGLQLHHRVVVVQINGFGGDAPGANLGPGLLDGVVADLHGWLAANGVARPAVIGHSLGGLVAMMLAKAHPEDAGRLMIVDSLPFVGEMFVPNATVAMLAPQAAALRDRSIAQYGRPQDAAANAAVAAGLALTPAARAKITTWIGQADPRVSGEALYEDLSTDLRPALPAIQAAITLVYPWSADKPEAVVAQVYRRVYADARHVTYVGIANSGHFAMLDQPAAFAAAVDAFLR